MSCDVRAQSCDLQLTSSLCIQLEVVVMVTILRLNSILELELLGW